MNLFGIKQVTWGGHRYAIMERETFDGLTIGQPPKLELATVWRETSDDSWLLGYVADVVDRDLRKPVRRVGYCEIAILANKKADK